MKLERGRTISFLGIYVSNFGTVWVHTFNIGHTRTRDSAQDFYSVDDLG